MESKWYLYLLRCRDGSLYCGITTDVARRFDSHCAGKGAKYTRGRRPLELVYTRPCLDHSDALKQELAVKALPREKKLALLRDYAQDRDRELPQADSLVK